MSLYAREMLKETSGSSSVPLRAYLARTAAMQMPGLLPIAPRYIERTVVQIAEAPGFGPNDTPGIKDDPQLLIDVVMRRRKWMLLGETGMGKTSSLLHIARTMAERALTMPRNALIPIYVELKHYCGETTLAQLLVAALRTFSVHAPAETQLLSDAGAHIVYAGLAQPDTRFLILLDGLDEIRPEHQDRFQSILNTVLNSRHHVIIGTGDDGLDDMSRGDMPIFTLEPFGFQEIRTFLDHTLPGDGDCFYNRHLLRNRRLAALAVNPLMLSLMSALMQSRPNTHLSTSNARLFHQYIMQVIRGAADEKLRMGVSPRATLSLLGRIGFEMQERQCVIANVDIVREWRGIPAGNRLDASLNQAMRWGLLKPGVEHAVEFAHPFFLQYFAALQLHAELHRGADYARLIGSRLLNKRWANAIALLAGVMDQASGLIRWLAGALRCPEREISAISPEIREPATPPRARAELLREWGERLRDSVARVLAQVGPPAVDELVAVLGDEDPNARWRAVEVLGRIGNSTVAASLMLSLRDSNLWVRKSAVNALGQVGDPCAIEPLTALSRNPSEYYLRQDADAALGRLSRPAAKPTNRILETADAGTQMDVDFVEDLERIGGTRYPPQHASA